MDPSQTFTDAKKERKQRGGAKRNDRRPTDLLTIYTLNA